MPIQAPLRDGERLLIPKASVRGYGKLEIHVGSILRRFRLSPSRNGIYL